MGNLFQFIKSKKPGVKPSDLPEDEFRELARLHMEDIAERRKKAAKEKVRLSNILKEEKKKAIRHEARKHKNQVTGEPKQYKSYRLRANAKRIKFELSQDEFFAITEMDCNYCGGTGGGVDRINSKEGYIKSNCVPCCSKCNMMKYTYSIEDFIKHVKKIYTHTAKD